MVTLTCELDLEDCALPEGFVVSEYEKLEIRRALDHRYFNFTHRKHNYSARKGEQK
jgi:hypothetical protein